MQKVEGLTSVEAVKRLKKYGPNEIERKKQLPWLKLLLDQFRSPLIYILFFAGLVTLFLKEWTDSVVIFLSVAVNTVLGFIQEFKAEKSLVALKKMLVPHASVIRDGKEEVIEAKDIVPGDLVVLNTGDKVSADGIVVEGVDLHVNEAILTGESLPVRKSQITNHKSQTVPTKKSSMLGKAGKIKNLKIDENKKVFMGTVVVSGRGGILVTKTGMQTRMGQLAGKLKETIEEETPLKQQVAKLSKILALVFSLICVVIFFEGLYRQRHWLEMFTLSVAVAVAAIPEGLAISLTVILTLGMQRILKKKGLVRKLLAAETLGSVDVICADKTGTLTEGKMKVVSVDTINEEQMKKGAVLCNNMNNPIAVAMMEWALRSTKGGSQAKQVLQGKKSRVDEISFSSERKFVATLHRSAFASSYSNQLADTEDKKATADEGEIFLSGAPEMIMEVVSFTKAEKAKWQKKLDEYTKKGLRVVAFASRFGDLDQLKTSFSGLKKDFRKYDGHVDGNWDSLKLQWLGLLLFEDPVRMEVKPALAACQRAGIRVKVITGDYKNTAIAVLKKLELDHGQIKDEQVMEGWELEKISKEELAKKIDDIVLFARTTPEQKIRIVEALQEKGHTVAMMGDGVNDVLALKRADIGVVVGEASEVAKETADMILLDSNFETIVASVEEGRGIFENIKKVVLYLLSDSFTEVFLIGGSLLFGLPVPILPAQILWVNLVEDGLPGIALAFEPKDEGLMKEPPRSKGTPIIDKEIKILIFIIGLVTDFFLFGIFLVLLKLGLPIGQIRTIVFAGLAIDSLLYVFSCKTLRKNLWNEKIFSNRFLNISVLIGFLMLFAGIYLPFFNKILKTTSLTFGFWFLILSKGLVTITGIEVVKFLFLKKKLSVNSK